MPRQPFASLALAASALATLAVPVLLAAPAHAAGDLLVAPTRIVLDGARGTEVILNNIGAEAATYRISLQIKRMTPDGGLVDVEDAARTPRESAAAAMIAWAPRRVTLPPNQPQAIRIGVRAPADLPDGEYRAHMLFRAIPDAKPATARASTGGGISIALKPIYGVTIPIIVRRGALTATAGIANARLVDAGGKPGVSFDLSRAGGRSTYGEVRVLKAGVTKPVVLNRGIAVYSELERRNVTLPVADGVVGSIAGPATIQYLEQGENGSYRTIAEARVVLR